MPADVSKDLSVQIMEAVKDLLPKGTGFVMIVGDVATADMGITSNMPDELAVSMLEDAIQTIKSEPATDLEVPSKKDASLN